MKDITTALMQQFRREHKAARRYMALLLALALLTSLFVNWQLHSVGIAQTADYQCGEIEHQHTAECYEKVLVCGYEEGEPEDWNATKPDDSAFPDADYGVEQSDADIAAYSAEPEPEYIFVPHQHTDDCYQEVKTLTCYEEEHVHTDDCFDPEDGSLICDLFEHTHDDSCYTTEYELVCGLEEGELVEEPNPDYVPVDEEASAVFDDAVALQPVVDDSSLDTPVHHHTDACYEEVLVCGLPEHHHTVNCLSDPLADVEDEETWSAKTNVVLTGAWADDLTAVAKSQLGYQQSERNFQLDDEDQTTVRHYTRYGAWYGNAYGAWDVMFLSYCLNYADVPQTTVPQRAGVQALRSDLRGSEWLKAAAEVELVPGDIVFYNSITTETVAVEEDAPQIMDDSADADIALLSLEPAAAEPQTEERTVSTETVGIVSDVDADTGTLTVISGDVDGKVAEVSLRADEITDVIDLAAAHKAQEEAPEEEPETVPEENEGFSAKVEWIGETVEQDADYPMMMAMELNDSGINLSDHITNVVISKKEGKNWVPIEDEYRFKDGEAVQVELSYQLSGGIVSSKNDTLTYHLPAGLTLTEDNVNGKVYRLKEVVGSYTISKSGEVKMTFTNKEILDGAPFTGDFTFEADVDYSQAGADGKVIFNDDFNLIIKKPDGDIAVKKGLDKEGYAGADRFNYGDKNGNYYLRWHVQASTEKGTGGKTVRIGDQLNGDSSGSFQSGSGVQVLGSYVENSVKVFKLKAGQNAPGNLVPSNEYKLTVSNENELSRFILVEDLPALEPGESYILCYTTKVTPEEMNNKCKDNDGKIYNKGLAGIEDAPDVVTKDATYVSFWRRLSKDGTLNKDGTITWTITLKAAANGYGEFLRGYTVKDVIPAGLTVKGDVTVEADGENFATITAQTLKDGYTIPDDSKAMSYTFTFRTDAPTQDGAVTNKATATKGSDTFTAEKELVFGKGDWGVSKKHVSTNSDGVASWDIVVTNTLGGTNFTLVDVMDARDANNQRLNVDADGPRHWFYKSDLETAVQKSLKLTLRDGNTKDYADVWDKLTIEAFSDYHAQAPVTDDTTRARAFKITVKDLPVRRMELTVTTHEDRDKVTNGETRKYVNWASVEGTGKSKDAQDTYTRIDSFEKKVSTDKGNTYNKGSTVAYKDVGDKRLCYSVALTTDASQTKEIVIVDTLPLNTKYLESQTELLVDGKKVDKNNKADENNHWSAVCDNNGTLTLHLSNYNTDGQSHTVQFLYKVKISDDPSWKDLSVSQISYKNTAKWGKEESSTATTVTRDATEVKKTGEQVKENGQPTNRVRYTVYINPSRKRLNNGEPLTLQDKLELKAGADAYGDLSTVKFYSYEFSGGQPTIGDELLEGVCQILPPDKGYWLQVRVPDETAIVMQYECEIDPGTAVTPELSNSVYLNDTKKDGINTEVHHNSSGATVKMGQLLLNKMDSYTGMPLKGAQFSIEYYDKQKEKWTPWDTRSTGESGKITLGVTTTGESNTLKTDTLYRLMEMEAPANYKLDQTPHYVLFAQETEDHEAAYQAATGTANNLIVDGVTVEKNSIVFGSDVKTTTMEIRNTYQELTVVKSWLDKDTGKSVEAPVTEVKVQLYSMNKDGSGKTAVGEEVSLNSKNKWSYTWPSTDTPATDNDGNPCYYMVEETTTGSWTLETSNNNGIQTGKIYLRNYVYSSYVLPSTGGMGTVPFAAVGGMLTVGAALLLAKRKKHEEKGE
ncbi:Cna B-type domain-containing protein [Faecalibacterium sp. HTF-128]|uniref:Cna B-type domain-containing protein n=1 Tax=Faecalibacterium wellingii TaxID=2929491 RepID=A0AB35Y6W7_9FIRM